MTRLVFYVAHPVAPSEDEIEGALARHMANPYAFPISMANKRDIAQAVDNAIHANLTGAMKWLSWLRCSFPETTFIAPWIADIQSGADDSDPAARERGLIDCCAVVERCDGIVLVGPRISTGMARERDHGLAHGMDDSTPEDPVQTFAVYDLVGVFQVDEPGWVGSGADRRPISFADWAEPFRQ